MSGSWRRPHGPGPALLSGCGPPERPEPRDDLPAKVVGGKPANVVHGPKAIYCRSMHVALVMNARLLVHAYGGSERVVASLGARPAGAGHAVTLIASTGTRTPADSGGGSGPPGTAATRLRRLCSPAAGRGHRAQPPPAAGGAARALGVDLHGNPPPGTVLPDNTIFLSANRAMRHGHRRFVYNGLDLSEYRYQANKADYDLFLGRLHSVKGYRLAIEGARRAGSRLIVAGGWRPSLRRGLSYAGRVGGERKAALLAGARCLWMPALWDEPFGLTLIEALASGTPVIGTRRGALPEIVTAEVGVLGDTIDELVEAASRVEKIDPASCRARVERPFTHRVMAENYVREYALAL